MEKHKIFLSTRKPLVR